MLIDNDILYDVHNEDINADGSFIIPNRVTTIGKYALFGRSALTSITIGNGVTSIGREAFSYCIGLPTINIPDSVTDIGECAFYKCFQLTSISVPNSVTRIGLEAFCFTRLTSKPNNYKAFALNKKGKLLCRDKIYTVGKKSMVYGELEICKNGIHYCTNIFDIFNYYFGEYGRDFVIGICEVSKENIGGDRDSKRCARWVKPTKILSKEEVVKIMNGEE